MEIKKIERPRTKAEVILEHCSSADKALDRCPRQTQEVVAMRELNDAVYKITCWLADINPEVG